MPVRILPDSVVNRIRAGEVVERPASLVKELLDNAVDAGAREIRVALRDGGRAMAQVDDDGCGMSAEDLVLSVERHATSKIDGHDLSAVATLGFRGEALAAIGAVARLTVQTRRQGDECGWAVDVDNGAKGAPRPCAQRPGTRVLVRDLFAAHPARAAFLRPARHERALVRGVVEAHALARPDVAFRLDADGRALLSLPATAPDARIRDVMGREFTDNSVPFAASAPGMSVRGRVGLPTWGGHAAAGQRLLVNGRPVRDRLLSAALREAFADVSKERAPSAVVDLRLDPSLVDVNVHPAKSEVRFADPRSVADLLRKAAADAVGAAGPRAAARLSEAAAAARPVDLAIPADSRRLPLGRVLGLALDGFVVAETVDGIVVVDFHAAHERIVHERLKAAALSAGVPTRPLPRPVAARVGERAAALLDERAGDLARLGLAAQAADGGHVLVTAVPEPLYGTDAARLVSEVAAALLEDPHADPLRGLLERLCALLACHAALRSGDAPSRDELEGLLREMEATPNAGTCNHGRPTAIHLSRAQVEGLFGRR